MLAKLPGWVVDNATSVRDECADYRGLTLERRGEILHAVCEMAVLQAMSRADRTIVFEWRDKLPKSTVAALARMREKRP